MTIKSNAYILQSRWQERLLMHESRFQDKQIYVQLTSDMLEAGMPLQALEVIEEAFQYWCDDIDVMLARGLVLAKSGATQAASRQLSEVVNRIKQQPSPNKKLLEEAIGLLARTEKDYGLKTDQLGEREKHFHASLDLYKEAYQSTGGYWTGINVATLQALLGYQEEAKLVANQIYQECLRKYNSSCEEGGLKEPDGYWLLATLGESSIILEDMENAERWYRRAYQHSPNNYGSIRSTQRHLELLLNHFQQDSSLTKKWLPLPAVAVFTGHLIDSPDRQQSRFPVEYEPYVRDAIERWIDVNDVKIGISSAASGSDIIFQEVLHERGGECHVVLPFSEDLFVKTSVIAGEESRWVERFGNVISNATAIVRTARDETDQGPLAYQYANQIIAGTARIKAKDLGTDLLGLSVWDGLAGAVGGTSDAVNHWRSIGIPMTRVQLPSHGKPIESELHLVPVKSLNLVGELEGLSPPIDTQNADTQIMSLLFADAVGYSQLSDREVRIFMKEYLGRVAQLIEIYHDDIAVRETAGDGLYLAFRSIVAAGKCALELSSLVDETPWKKMGFNTQLRLRVALHTGPVILGHDFVTGLPKGVGAHVSRAARLEPKTPPGQVFASEAFAALAQLEESLPFQCRYVKQLEWAKRYGTFPTYLVTSG